jgi:hypothetical protein
LTFDNPARRMKPKIEQPQGRDFPLKWEAPKVQIRRLQKRMKLSGKRTLRWFPLESLPHWEDTDGANPALQGESLRSLTEGARLLNRVPFFH